MNLYGLYDIKENEQCVLIGSIKEIANYLRYKEDSLRKYLHRKKKVENLLIAHRYDLTKIEDFLDETEKDLTKKSDKEIFKELLYAFTPNIHSFKPYKEKKTSPIVIVNEEWKTIKNFNYSVSNYGRIRNNTSKKIKELRNGVYGYQVNLWKNGKGKMFTLSRLVANYFIRPVKNNERVIHKDGNIRNNFYKNLEIVSK